MSAAGNADPDGMKIDWECRSRWTTAGASRDVFRPRRKAPSRDPFIRPGKGLAFQEGYKTLGNHGRDYPDAVAAAQPYATGRWSILKVGADGYVCVAVDSRGAGRSPGYLCTTMRARR